MTLALIRPAEPSEAPALARLWHDGWQDAHAAIVPADLKPFRTPENFARRMREKIADTRVMGPVGAAIGFYMRKDDELDQFYVASAARGTGAAQELMADAEARLAENGHALAWLACTVGNDRAARFYEKCGWRNAGVITIQLGTDEGPFPLEVWRYEKALR